MFTTDEVVKLLDGSEYPLRVSDDLREQMRANGIVVVYGASDDLMEFDGAIHDEIGAYEGETAYLTIDGLLVNECENEECPHFEKMKTEAKTIEAHWGKEPGYSWTYTTEIQHSTFEIVEDGEKYCRGIVFSLLNA